MKREVVLILNNIRSTHNVGSIFRTCEGFGVSQIYLTGYTPYPEMINDDRLPHLTQKINKQIAKVSLGAEKNLVWSHHKDPVEVIKNLKNHKFEIIALEQDEKSIKINTFKPKNRIAIIVGEEVNGISEQLIRHCDKIVEIPMYGKKESFNVSVATGIALYAIKF